MNYQNPQQRARGFCPQIEMENYIHETIMFFIDLLIDPSPSSSSPPACFSSSSSSSSMGVQANYEGNRAYSEDDDGSNCGAWQTSGLVYPIKVGGCGGGLHLKHLTKEYCNRGRTKPLKKVASGDSVEDRVLNFIWQHPSMFEVVNDHVFLRRMTADIDSALANTLDQRALDFIVFRCKQYGECKIMISKLFGNLKQAAFDIQSHFNNYVVFFSFLQSRQDVFIFMGDNFVALRSVYDKYALSRRDLPRCDEYIREPGVLECTQIVNDRRTAQQILDFVLRYRPVIAVDCEGVNLGAPNGEITLVQLAFVNFPYPEYYYPIDSPHPIPDIRPHIKVFLFDVQADRHILTTWLKTILESPDHIKIFQGCASDSKALRTKHNIYLRCVFDTVIAHHYLRQDEIKSDLYYLYETYVKDPTNRLKKDIKKLYIGNPRLWTTRPLSELLVYYAAFDVYALLRIHNAMLQEIHQHGSHDIARKFREIMVRSEEVASAARERPRRSPSFQHSKPY